MSFKSHQVFTRRRILQGTAAFAASSLLPGCGRSAAGLSTLAGPSPNSSLSALSSSGISQPVPSGTIVQGSVSVGATAFGATGFGSGSLAYEKEAMNSPGGAANGYRRFCDAGNTNAVGLFKTLAPSGGILRLGGNSVDNSPWNPTGAGQTANQISPSDVDALAGFLQATGWKCLYGIDLAGSAPGATYPTNTTLAAEEATYVAAKLGIHDPTTNASGLLLGLEIGNEPDLYGQPGGPYYGQTWNLSVFEQLWETYRSAVLAAVPALRISAPVFSGAGVGTAPTDLAASFAADESGKFALLDYHYYRTNPGANPTAASLLTPDTNLTGTVLPALNAAAAGAGVPFAITEAGSVGGVGVDGVSNTYAGALWAIDFLFNCAQGGALFAALESGNYNNYYSPIQDYYGVVQNPPLPDYYGVQFFNMAGVGTLNQTSVSASSLNVTAYALENTGGGLSLMIVNKDSSNNLQMSIQLPQSFSSGTLIEMTQASQSLTATDGVTIQGSGVSVDGAFTPSAAYAIKPRGSHASCYVPILSAVLLKFS